MPLFAIIHIDHEGIHPDSCTLIVASSAIAIAQSILENPDRWRAALMCAHADDGDSRSLWQRLQSDSLTPQALLTLIDKTTLDAGFGEMLRIYPIEIESLDDFQVETRWSNFETRLCSRVGRTPPMFRLALYSPFLSPFGIESATRFSLALL